MKKVVLLDINERILMVENADKHLPVFANRHIHLAESVGQYASEPVLNPANKMMIPINEYVKTSNVKILPPDYKFDQYVDCVDRGRKHPLDPEEYITETTFFCVDTTQHKLLNHWFNSHQRQVEGLTLDLKSKTQQYEACEKDWKRLFTILEGNKTKFETLKKASFWQRLKWVFTGVSI